MMRVLTLNQLIEYVYGFKFKHFCVLLGCRFLPQLARAALTKALTDASIHPPKEKALQRVELVKCELKLGYLVPCLQKLLWFVLLNLVVQQQTKPVVNPGI